MSNDVRIIIVCEKEKKKNRKMQIYTNKQSYITICFDC